MKNWSSCFFCCSSAVSGWLLSERAQKYCKTDLNEQLGSEKFADAASEVHKVG